MKALSLFVLVCSLFASEVHSQRENTSIPTVQDSGGSQYGWTQQQSPTTDGLLNVGFLNRYVGWAAVLHTSDGGSRWEFNDEKRIVISFVDDLHGWAYSPKGAGWISRTTDGGGTWKEINTGIEVPDHFYFSSAARGFCLDYTYQRIARSLDSGKTWDKSGPYCGNVLGFVSFDSMHIYAAGSNYIDTNPPHQNINGMFYSSDGGDHWEYTMKSPLPGSGFKPFGAYDSAHLYFIGGPAPHVSFSKDRGYTLKGFSLPSGSFYPSDGDVPNGGFVFDTNNIVIVGDAGKIYRTIDGINWLRQPCPVTTNLFAVTFVDSVTGWIVGDAGVILQTTNSGDSWVRVTASSTSLSCSLVPRGQSGEFVLHYTLPLPQHVSMTITDILGKNTAYITNGKLMDQGTHDQEIAVGDVPNGAYVLTLSTEKYRSVLKLVVNH